MKEDEKRKKTAAKASTRSRSSSERSSSPPARRTASSSSTRGRAQARGAGTQATSRAASSSSTRGSQVTPGGGDLRRSSRVTGRVTRYRDSSSSSSPPRGRPGAPGRGAQARGRSSSTTRQRRNSNSPIAGRTRSASVGAPSPPRTPARRQRTSSKGSASDADGASDTDGESGRKTKKEGGGRKTARSTPQRSQPTSASRRGQRQSSVDGHGSDDDAPIRTPTRRASVGASSPERSTPPAIPRRKKSITASGEGDEARTEGHPEEEGLPSTKQSSRRSSVGSASSAIGLSSTMDLSRARTDGPSSSGAIPVDVKPRLETSTAALATSTLRSNSSASTPNKPLKSIMKKNRRMPVVATAAAPAATPTIPLVSPQSSPAPAADGSQLTRDEVDSEIELWFEVATGERSLSRWNELFPSAENQEVILCALPRRERERLVVLREAERKKMEEEEKTAANDLAGQSATKHEIDQIDKGTEEPSDPQSQSRSEATEESMPAKGTPTLLTEGPHETVASPTSTVKPSVPLLKSRTASPSSSEDSEEEDEESEIELDYEDSDSGELVRITSTDCGYYGLNLTKGCRFGPHIKPITHSDTMQGGSLARLWTCFLQRLILHSPLDDQTRTVAIIQERKVPEPKYRRTLTVPYRNSKRADCDAFIDRPTSVSMANSWLRAILEKLEVCPNAVVFTERRSRSRPAMTCDRCRPAAPVNVRSPRGDDDDDDSPPPKKKQQRPSSPPPSFSSLPPPPPSRSGQQKKTQQQRTQDKTQKSSFSPPSSASLPIESSSASIARPPTPDSPLLLLSRYPMEVEGIPLTPEELEKRRKWFEHSVEERTMSLWRALHGNNDRLLEALGTDEFDRMNAELEARMALKAAENAARSQSQPDPADEVADPPNSQSPRNLNVTEEETMDADEVFVSPVSPIGGLLEESPPSNSSTTTPSNRMLMGAVVSSLPGGHLVGSSLMRSICDNMNETLKERKPNGRSLKKDDDGSPPSKKQKRKRQGPTVPHSQTSSLSSSSRDCPPLESSSVSPASTSSSSLSFHSNTASSSGPSPQQQSSSASLSSSSTPQPPSPAQNKCSSSFSIEAFLSRD